MNKFRPITLISYFILLAVYAVVFPVALLTGHSERFLTACQAMLQSLQMYLSAPTHVMLVIATVLLTTGFIYATLWAARNFYLQRKYAENPCKAADQLCAMTIGFFNPRVIISHSVKTQLSAEAYEAIAAHEAYHQAHYHPLVIFLSGFLSRWFFFIPYAKRFFTSTVLHLELKADQYAIQQTSKKALASALHEFFSRRGEVTVPLGAHFSFFTERVEAVIGERLEPKYKAVFIWPAAIVTLLWLLLPLYIVNSASVDEELYEREVNFFCNGSDLPAQSPMTPVQSKLSR